MPHCCSASDNYLNLQTVRQRLEQSFELMPGVMPGGGPVRYVQVSGTDLRIGFITPISQYCVRPAIGCG